MLNKGLGLKELMKLRCLLCALFSSEIRSSLILKNSFHCFHIGSPMVQRYGMGEVVSNEGCLYSSSQWWVGHPKLWEIWRGNILILSELIMYVYWRIGATDDINRNNVYSSLISSGTDWQASSKVVKVRSMEKGMTFMCIFKFSSRLVCTKKLRMIRKFPCVDLIELLECYRTMCC